MISIFFWALALHEEVEAFNGSWQTTFGVLVLKQDGAEVTGTYGPEKTLRGQVEGS